MGRFTDLDSDEARLPEGMTRIGYDADSQRYTFRDQDGSLWESAPGNQFGELRPVGYQPSEADIEATNLAIEEDHQSALRLATGRPKGKSEVWSRPYRSSRAVRKWQLVWYIVRFQRMRRQAVKQQIAVV